MRKSWQRRHFCDSPRRTSHCRRIVRLMVMLSSSPTTTHGHLGTTKKLSGLQRATRLRKKTYGLSYCCLLPLGLATFCFGQDMYIVQLPPFSTSLNVALPCYMKIFLLIPSPFPSLGCLILPYIVNSYLYKPPLSNLFVGLAVAKTTQFI